jgi:hypothetical protein
LLLAAPAYDLVRAHGEAGWTARLVPLTVDGLVYAGSMVVLDCARRKVPVPVLAGWLLGAARHGDACGECRSWSRARPDGCGGGRRSRWSYELLMMIIRAAQLGTGLALGGAPECVPGTDPLLVRAAQACRLTEPPDRQLLHDRTASSPQS